MPIVDVIILLLMFGGVGAGTYKIAISVKRRIEKMRRRKKGEHNAKGVLPHEDMCYMCEGENGVINPDNDFFIRGRWWHRKCFTDVRDKEIG